MERKDDELVGTKYLMKITNLGRTTIWRRLKEGLVPAPFTLGSSKPIWKKSTLDGWLSGLGRVGVEVVHG